MHVLGVSETWLTSAVADSFVALSNYRIERKDNPSLIEKHGVAVYIREDIRYSPITCPVNNVVAILLNDYDTYVLTVYRPPSYSAPENTALLSYLRDFCEGKNIILQGDFNLPSIKWDSADIFSSYISPLDREFCGIFFELGLTQMVEQSTFFPSGNVLDLLLTNSPERIGSCSVLPPLPGCHHSPVVVETVFQDSHLLDSLADPRTQLGPRQKRFIWSRGRCDLIAQSLAHVDWNNELGNMDVQSQYNCLLGILNPLIDNFVPTREQESVKPPWSINPPRRMKRAKQEAWRRFKQARSQNSRDSQDTLLCWNQFQECNQEIRNFAVTSQKNYETKLADQIKTHPKLFHAYINHRKKGRTSIGPLKLPNGRIIDDPKTMAKQFVSSFSRVFEVATPRFPAPNQTCPGILEGFQISPDEVYNILSAIDSDTSVGMDGMHPRLLKNLAADLALPLAIIFNASLSQEELPQEWLTAIVVPIYKDKSRFDPLNYRPVSLTSLVCKTIERSIAQRLTAYMEEHNIISERQYGFRSGYSTIDQLISTYNDVSLSMDSGMMTSLIFFDYSKAFDKVSHIILLGKLRDIGVCPQLVNWIGVFLQRRTMCVRVADQVSDVLPVLSGVPQGSVLGPILFLIYVNHVVADLSCKYSIFADDIKIYLSSTTNDFNNAGHDQLQGDIDLLVRTSTSWGLKLNSDKCKQLCFGNRRESPPTFLVDGIPVEVVNSHRDLGVIVDDQLKFHGHIQRKIGYLHALTTSILSCTLSRDSAFLMPIYKSHIRPKLEYGSCLWNVGFVGDVRKLERLQRRWTRSVSGLADRPYNERLRVLDLFSIKGRLLRADLIMVWKIFHGMSPLQPGDLFTLANSSRTRGHPLKIRVQRPNQGTRARFFSSRVVESWNALSHDTVTADTISKFKGLLHRDLGDKLFDYLN